ncbi:MAG: TIR domain-containing protein [Symploca sp. SIO1C2]|nr:TIR domain-containing protein [Symploca sp. SIO1C2]
MENAHALLVGIANYQSINRLPETVLKDAQDIYELLISPQHCGYVGDNVQLLLDGQATKANLTQALTQLAQRCNQDSTVFIYISSHGGQVEFGSYAGEYLLPVDTDYTSEESLAQTAISGTQFTDALRAVPAQKIVVVFDCCHSGGIGQPKNVTAASIKSGLPESYYDVLKEGRGRVILASSRSSEFSYILPNADNSLFTTHLLAGMRGKISSDDGTICIFNLFEYIQPLVTSEQPNQHPIFKAELEDNFPIALYLGGKKHVVGVDDDGFRYDAYISYVDEEPDTTWVWETLVPRLEDAGLRIAVSGEVEIFGVARVVNIERGIRQSKRTVIVLSDLYMANNIAEFENTLAQFLGLEEGAARLLPVCTVAIDSNLFPYRLKQLSLAKLYHPRRAQREFKKLIEQLQQPLPRRTGDGLFQ